MFCMWLVTHLKLLCSNFQRFPERIARIFFQGFKLVTKSVTFSVVVTLSNHNYYKNKNDIKNNIQYKNVCSLYFFNHIHPYFTNIYEDSSLLGCFFYWFKEKTIFLKKHFFAFSGSNTAETTNFEIAKFCFYYSISS